MEKRKNALSYLMIMLCICMQMAMAYPHHHHSDSICVKTDLVNDHSGACNETAHHHANDGDKHSCSSFCITKFECGTSHHLWHLTPIYSFYTVIYTYTANNLPKLPIKSEPGIYIERLHAQHFIRTQKLRGPPVLG